jgi:predicted RNase H-like HicB family nuclease
MKYAVIFTKDKSQLNYNVTVPDLPGCAAQVDTIDKGIEEITKSIKSHLSILAEYGESIPNALTLEKHRVKYEIENPHTYSLAFWAIVDIDITVYLGKSHKINVTLPELLISQIDVQVSKSVEYKTRSGFIAAACLAELQKNI